MVNELHHYHDAIWFDRYEVNLTDEWGAQVINARQNATYAIVILSEDYLNTPYCREEYEQLFEREIPIIAVIANDIPVTEFTAQIQVVDWIDFRSWADLSAFKKTIKRVLEYLPPANQAPHHNERRFHLYWLINALETKLMSIPTSRAIFRSHPGIEYDSTLIRPRGYDISLLAQQNFGVQKNDQLTDIDDLLEWVDAHPRFILSGHEGSGKSVNAILLTLWMTHRAISDHEVVLPFWFDLALWHKDQSMEQYFETHWSLAFHWSNWLESNPAFLVFDNWSDFYETNPDGAKEFSTYLDTIPNHKLILIARSGVDIDEDLPTVVIGRMQNHQIQRLAREFLPEDQIVNLKRLAAENKNRLEFDHIDFVSTGVELLALDPPRAIDAWFTNPVESLITVRWYTESETINPSFSLDYLIKTMKMLAWYMMQQPQYHVVDQEIAQEVVFQEEALSVALELGILERVGAKLRFHSMLFQWYLATEHLVRDGVYKHISYPKFLDNGQRAASRWDDVIFAALDRVSDVRKNQIVDQVAEIDPYLAWLCIQQHPRLYDSYLTAIVVKLIELRSKNPESHVALASILQKMHKPEEVAVTIVTELPHYDWGIQQWLWSELLRLPYEVPPEFLKQVSTLERESPDAIGTLLESFTLAQCAAYLSQLMNSQTTQLQSNAIWLSGKLQHESARVGLFNLLDNPSSDIRDQAMTTLSAVANQQLIQQLLIWLRQHLEYGADVGALLFNNERYVSGRLLMLLHKEQQIDDMVRNAIIKHSEKDIALAVANFIASETDQDLLDDATFERDDDNIMKVQKLLQSGLQHLSRDSFHRLVEDINRVLGIPSTNEQVVTAHANDELYQRAQTAVSSVRPAEPDSPVAKSDDIKIQLQDADWFIRRAATEQLANLDTETALPLLLQSARDEEAQVRVVALNLLAKFSQHDTARQALIDALSDPEYLVIDVATDLLKAAEKLDEAKLLSLFDNDNIQTIAALAEITGHRQLASAVPYLIKFLGDERTPWLGESTLDEHVKTALRKIETPDALRAINPVNPNVTDIQPQSALAQSDKQKTLTTTDKITLALKALKSDNWELAQKSARFLRELSEKLRGTEDMNIVSPLSEAMNDTNWHVRWAVAESLAWLQHPAAIPNLVKRLNDSHWMVQVAVIRALVELEASQHATDIAGLLAHPNNAVRETAAEALGALGNPKVLQALERTMEFDDDFVRLASIKAICEILDDDREVEYLLRGLEDSYVHIRWFSTKKLLPHIGKHDTDLLAQLLRDNGKPAWEDLSISDFAYEKLLEINTSEAKKIIEQHDRRNEQDE